MQLQENVSLKHLNTFGIEAFTRYFTTVTNAGEAEEILSSTEYAASPKLILGGGSNVLFTRNWDGITVLNSLKGIEIVTENDDEVTIKAASGENWHRLVMYSVDRNFGGIENLSLIPGTVGAAPMQNIGAYGVEIKDTLLSVDFYDIENKTVRTLTNGECEFGYRESIFKRELKNKAFILSITIKLSKKPVFNTSYGAIQQTLEKLSITDLSVKAVSDAVISIRQSKLPDPANLGNAGSFFKNPEIPTAQYLELQAKYPDIPGYKVSDDITKVPAGWLIEQTGWKGKVVGNTGCHKDQALVIVNYGNASGDEIKKHAENVINSVQSNYGIRLLPEVNII